MEFRILEGGEVAEELEATTGILGISVKILHLRAVEEYQAKGVAK